MKRAAILATFFLCASTAWIASAQPVSQAPQGPQMRVVVPAYFVPWPGSPWERLNATAAAHPGRIVAIANVFNGPGIALSPAWRYAFQTFRGSGGALIGYVYSSYGARPIADVKAEIDLWFTWYGVDGIFIDEMSNVAGAHEAYYAELNDHVQALLPDALVISNPGKATEPSYLTHPTGSLTSALCIYESDDAELRWKSDAWVQQFDRRHFCAFAYETEEYKWRAAVDNAWRQNCGFVYVTDDLWPNPWDTMPAYFESLAAYIDTTY
ncbi:MAG: spherulation-specific family 4 protein [Planctomycetota bacterium]